MIARIVVFFILFALPIIGFDQLLDTVAQKQNTPSDNKMERMFFEIKEMQKIGTIKGATIQAEKLLLLANQHKDEKYQLATYLLLLQMNNSSQRNEDVLKIIKSGFNFIQKKRISPENLEILFHFLEITHTYLNNNYPELDIHTKVLDLIIERSSILKNSHNYVAMTALIGRLYYNQRDFEEALHWNKLSFTATNASDTINYVRSGIVLSLTYAEKNQLQTALSILASLEPLVQGSNTVLIHLYYGNYAQLLELDNQIEKAVHLFQSLYSRRLEDSMTQIELFESSFRIARMYYTIDTVSKALKWATISYSHVDTVKTDQLIRLYELIELIYIRKNNFEKAHEYLKKRTDLVIQTAKNVVQPTLYNLKSQIDSSTINQQYVNLETTQETQSIILYVFISFSLILLILIMFLVQLIKRTKRLNDVLAEQHQLISNQKNDLQEAVETKDRILSIIGHDLRGSISTMYSYLDLLSDSDLSIEAQKSVHEQLQFTMETTMNMLDNLIYWGKTIQNSVSIQHSKIEINRLVKELLEQQKLLATSKSIQLISRCNTSFSINSDERLLSVIIRNLLANAIKFTAEGGTVSVDCKIIENNKRVEFTITDTGIGMSQALLEQLESGYSTSQQGTHNEKGFGLGIQLVKHFTRLLNGTLVFKSTEGKGTTVVVQIPNKVDLF